ncbi:MAG: CDP-alcohol phosphatidyltransferase family protein [Proteobacteria bacterium]|nr:CDP-alcohol phosphatidyltransferase family protein [Pseudomonadota bacterium]
MYRDHLTATGNRWLRVSAFANDARLMVALTALPVFLLGAVVLPTRNTLFLTMAMYGLAAVALLFCAARTGQMVRFGYANRVTWIRVALTVVIAGALAGAPGLVNWWVIAALAGVALALDGLDGYLARRFAACSAFGARFDMETDAALILVLSLLIGLSDKTGLWILAAGALRYLFVAAGWIWPRLMRPLPYSAFRRAVCAIQIGALLICLLPVVTSNAATVIGGSALVMLCLSFGRDILWLVAGPVPESVPIAKCQN